MLLRSPAEQRCWGRWDRPLVQRWKPGRGYSGPRRPGDGASHITLHEFGIGRQDGGWRGGDRRGVQAGFDRMAAAYKGLDVFGRDPEWKWGARHVRKGGRQGGLVHVRAAAGCSADRRLTPGLRLILPPTRPCRRSFPKRLRKPLRRCSAVTSPAPRRATRQPPQSTQTLGAPAVYQACSRDALTA